MSSTNSTSFSYLSSASNRFSGLASGMDIDGIVEKLMKAESAKMEKLQQQKQRYEWQREAYRSVNTKLEAFRTETFAKYGKQSDFIVNKVSISNDSKLSAVATASATGTLNITSATIAKVATSAQKGANVESNLTKVGELLGAGTTGSVTLEVSHQDGTTKDVTVEYTEEDTLESIAQKINSQNKGMTAIVGNDGTFSLTSAATGNFTGGTIKLKDDSNSLFSKLGFNGSELANGSDASYTVNGVTKISKTNSITISGYNIQLKESFVGSPVAISSTLDTDSVVDKVKSFIELYNGLIKDLKEQTSEKKNYDYAPLTDAQRAEMKEGEIKKWEEQAKKGIIRGDRTIESALSNMRAAISDATIDLADGKKMSIFSLGLDTQKSGEIIIKDEAKLRQQIEKDPTSVANLFTKSASSTNGEGGIISKVRASAKTAVDTIVAKAGKEGSVEDAYTLGKDIKSVEQRINDWKDRLKTIEDRYYKQFTAMETAIQKANSQSSIFTQG